jgi:glycosyltransferase involved in cell wall biosynthesis
MKIIIIGVFLRENSALSEYFLKMADKFVKLGYRVIVISDESREDLVDTKSNPMILTWPSYYPHKVQDFIFIKALIKKYRPHMLISNFTATNLFFIVGRMYNVPHRIAWFHSSTDAFKEIAKWKKWRRKYILKLGTHFIANSNATKLDNINTYGISEDKITVLPNLINANDLQINLVKDWKITFVGRFHKSKGIDILIKAMAIVIDEFPSLKLEIIAGGEKNEYVKLVKQYNLQNNIQFLGRLPRKKVLEHLANSQFSVVPSLAEAFGYVIIESFSVKTPVIGSDTGGISEIINNNINGLLFSVGNYKELAYNIINLLKDKELRESYSEGAYSSFKKLYELQNIEKHINIFQKILNNN